MVYRSHIFLFLPILLLICSFILSLFRMAWECSASSNAALVRNLNLAGIISKPRVIEAMKHTDRKFYCPHFSYADSPQSIGYSATISAPHMHGTALEQLESKLQPGARVLDVGSGSGYLVAAMARMVGKAGYVKGVEHIQGLVDLSKKNLQEDAKHDPLIEDMLKQKRIEIVRGDGRLGSPQDEQFDAIHVGAAAPDLPKRLTEQLKPHGKMIIPVGTTFQDIFVYDKDAHGNLSKKFLFSVRYVPLTDPPSDYEDM
ncbi:protein-L-isoaspartate O-methyltransferase Pcm2 [Schizosaccharomyces cryophilus OY26]|uniref:protein-L-isoaspartate(D-aspartate) O-methyltransferase n=1 Tax=Schizosaccharomyces cryophilus (strain OY26 / ATCC MYA-4695 / CBS 11777 / NBRC 106824 / NRRL Y48691) TaxID=653667 RepID=S9XHD4_SCHCR|nr:protein-L-isoaspartate O-methyltransferase Pcm2 [Schizosaccharomyces cryophilus OY26]EPY53086.1 protein-L-isoaspartate O-methyltransferase Pcm2 [Schizosaccharomyces cryophilus OY26]